jgi:photosystem II stability/assembly factor-like uncharacterized protein
MRTRLCLLTIVVCFFGSDAQPQAPASAESSFFGTYKWRSIGPSRGGRSIAVTGVKGRRNEAYFGAVGGGLWKTVDGGIDWSPMTDGQIGSSSVGAVAVSESNPDIVFIGTGESCIRGNIMPGDGVYKSADAGKTWMHIGFEGSDAISKIRIDPTNPDVVFVADFGRYGGPSDERGVFRSTDGGKTWKKVLFRDNKTGAVDIAIDRKNPRVVYAALWEAYRVEYQMSSGGPGSGLFKSGDGGDTWTEITRNAGLPQGVVGRIGIAVSGADSSRIYALIENENGGLFSSDDAGATWKLINDGRNIRQRAFYYTHVFADPRNKDVVYMLNTASFRSTDGGKTLTQIGRGTHGDHHDLWIDPDDSEHVMEGNDGGGAISYNVSSQQRNWSREEYPTGQFYHVTTTAHLPFHVCGAQQDSTTMCVPSSAGRIPVAPYQVGGGEPGYIAADPRDPDIFYAGANNGSFLTRLNRRTAELKEVGAYPRFFSGESSSQVKERWQWTYPIIFSPVQSNVLYTSSQRIWKSTDEGQTWQAISGDLSRHDPKTMQESGGPITHDMNSPEIYGTVFSIGPGKTDVNIIWSGSDDGVVQLTRDGGKAWMNVTPPGMPEFGRVSQIDASAFDAGSAYVAVKRMLLGDKSPYIFRTHDFGKTWTKIVNGIGAADFTHTVREDKTRKGLLYAGTEHGFYISYDDGDHWESLRLNLPDTQVSDIWVEANELAISTMGRGFYVLDDVAALRQYTPTLTAASTLLKPATTIRGVSAASITYWLKEQPKSLTLDILDGNGRIVRTFAGTPPRAPAAEGAATGESAENDGGPARPAPGAPMKQGLNRLSWDLSSQPIVSFPGMVLWGATQNGPAVLPGPYRVRITADGWSETQSFEVRKHPQRDITDADLRTQFDDAAQIRDKVNEANNAVIQIRRIKEAVTDRLGKSDDRELKAAADRLTRGLSAVEEDIYQVRNRSNQDPLNFPIKTNNRLASLLRVVESGDGKPTSNVMPIFDDLKQELKAETDRLQQVISGDLPLLNGALRRLNLEAINEK